MNTTRLALLALLTSLTLVTWAQEQEPSPAEPSPAEPSPEPTRPPAPILVRSGLGLELSGVARVKGGFLLADDELVGSVTWLRDLEAPRTQLVKLYRRERGPNRLYAFEDVEDLAVSGGTVYVLGSHHGKLRKQNWTRRAEREFLVRAAWDEEKGKLRVPSRKKDDPKHEVYTKLIDHLAKRHPDLTRGLNAEGLALTAKHVQIGLRAPLTATGKAVILRARTRDLFGPKREAFKGDFERFELDLSKQGVRALFWDPQSERLLVVSGPVYDDPTASCGLWTYDLQRQHAAQRIASFPPSLGTLEALCRLDGETLLLAFDSDASEGRLLRWTWRR